MSTQRKQVLNRHLLALRARGNGGLLQVDFDELAVVRDFKMQH
jgi:hypothetical protein